MRWPEIMNVALKLRRSSIYILYVYFICISIYILYIYIIYI